MGEMGGPGRDPDRETNRIEDVYERRQHMKRNGSCIKWAVLSAVAMLGLTLAPATRADTIVFNPTGGVATGGGFNPGNFTITSLNYGAGDALAVAAVTSGSIVGVGSTFQLYYQGNLSSVNSAGGGGSVTPAGLNVSNGYQITEVASFTEIVTSLSSNAVTFGLAPTQKADSGVKIYFQDLTKPGAVPVNYNTGAGFNPAATAGQVIFSASLTSNQSNYTDTTKTGANPGTPSLNPNGTAYPGVLTDNGTGGNNLNMAVQSLNPAFFVTPGISVSNFTSNLTNPFSQIQAAAFFNRPNDPLGTAPTLAPNVTGINGVTGPDFLLQVSGATQSFSVPEPASFAMALTALGLVPLAAWQVRRRQTRTAPDQV